MEVRLIPAQRRNHILDLLQQQGSVHVARLSELLGVSAVTIHRDLGLLEQERLLERTHGGTVLSRRMRVEPLRTVWFCPKPLIDVIEEQGKDWVGGCPKDRNVLFKNRWTQFQDCIPIIPAEACRSYKIGDAAGVVSSLPIETPWT